MLESTAFGGSGLDGELAAIAARLRQSTVQVMARGGHGSGLIASADGIVVTNAHVANGRHVHVVLCDGREMRGEIVARAPDRDLAAIRLGATTGLPVAEFRDTRTLRPGDVVIAVGNPLDLVGAVTTGIVYAADRLGRKVVADLRLLPGNSGGPLADVDGRIVGVNAMVIDGLAVAISSAVVRRFLAAPSEQPYLGVVTRPVVVDVMGDRRLGLLVTEVVERSACARAGSNVGDVVIGVDGRLFSSPDDLLEEIESATVGARLRLDVVRAGRVVGVDVIVGDARERATAA
jgi:serine protease Do